ncbi:hypothetical protein ACHAXA_006745 [Cyclostephanos tholiformis]|uniref:4-hydroxyphenylpyruvate dioxygenase n=1 Tax=Cyclostephanos tholiformis TaxID=382380 RepID=A0ABD3SRY0_9STRA
MHPKLIPNEYGLGPIAYLLDGTRVFEAYADYAGEKGITSADVGTRLRFVEPFVVQSSTSSSKGGKVGRCNIPGIVNVPAEFPPSLNCHQAYFDHWVSNVTCRTGFIDTLEDVLSFVPIVDFNAGIVAKGKAQIKSTVTGNNGGGLPSSDTTNGIDADDALMDQGQIYLPINNTLTDAGHVYGFLREIGQGVQHIASRMRDIVDFVQRVNDKSIMFGEGFAFLSIPRSYYGILTVDMLVGGISPRRRGDGMDLKMTGEFLSADCAVAIHDICTSGGLLHDDSSLVLDATEDMIKMTIGSRISPVHRKEYVEKREGIVETILHSCYVNLYNLLRVR